MYLHVNIVPKVWEIFWYNFVLQLQSVFWVPLLHHRFIDLVSYVVIMIAFLAYYYCCAECRGGSYNVSDISYLNLYPLLLSFITLSQFLKQFQQVSFLHLHTSVYIICTIFIFLSLFPAPPLSPWCQLLTSRQNLFSNFLEDKT
jgi:hypothetical protein